MKTKICLVILLVAVLFAGISCKHTHAFATTWSNDSSSHWHASTCGHDVTGDKAQHTMVNGVCSVCGFTMLGGEWKIDVKPTLNGLVETYLAAAYDPAVVAQAREYYTQLALVQMMAALEKSNLDAFVLKFEDGKISMSYNDMTISCPFTINENNEVFITYDGKTDKFGVFDAAYTTLTCIDNFGFGSMVLSKNPTPYSILWTSFFEGNPALEEVKARIAAGADINAGRETEGRTVLIYVIDQNLSDIAIVLIEAGANVNSTDGFGRDALFAELSHDDKASLDVVKALLAHGADPNAYVGEKGDSLLMYACLYCPDAIKLALIEGGANVKAKDASGRTALLYELAREKNASVDVIKAMLAKGATAADAGKLNDLGAKEFATQFCTAEVAALL